MKPVAANLKKLRTARGMTQDDLAEQLHVVRQTVSLWENGKREPDIETLISIAAVLDCEVTELIYGPRPDDSFLSGRKCRLRLAVVFVSLFAVFFLCTLLWKPLLKLAGPDYYYSLIRFYSDLLLPTLMWCTLGMALVFSFAVFRDLRLRQSWIRLVLIGVAVLILLSYVFFVTGLVSMPWYMRIFTLLAKNQAVFLLPGLMLGIGLNR